MCVINKDPSLHGRLVEDLYVCSLFDIDRDVIGALKTVLRVFLGMVKLIF